MKNIDRRKRLRLSRKQKGARKMSVKEKDYMAPDAELVEFGEDTMSEKRV